MNKKIKYLLECLNKKSHFLAYRKEMIFNDHYDNMATKYNIYNAAYVTVHEGEKDEYKILKITNMLRLKNAEMKHFTTLKSNYVSFKSEMDLLLFLVEYCDLHNVQY